MLSANQLREYANYSINERSLYLYQLNTRQNIDRTFKSLVALSSADGITNREITAQIGAPDMLFYLSIGMIPNDGFQDYITTNYGSSGDLALVALQENTLDDLDVVILKDIIHREKDISIDKLEKMDNDSFFKQYKDELLALTQKKIPYLKGVFIPKLLRILSSKEPNLRDLFGGTTPVSLSEEGRARWSEAIATNSKFVPFYDLSHLRAYITEAKDLEKLDYITQNNTVALMLEGKTNAASTPSDSGLFSRTSTQAVVPHDASETKDYKR